MKKQLTNQIFPGETSLIGNVTIIRRHQNDVRATLNCLSAGEMGCDVPLLNYPIDMSRAHNTRDILDLAGVLCITSEDGLSQIYHPLSIAQFALLHWNAYLANGEQAHRAAFLAQAYWLRNHVWCISNKAAGWLVPCASRVARTPRLTLSALTQGCGLSTLIRAYQLTGHEAFLHVAQQVIATFELDILDCGINAPIGDMGLFFEECAVYPAHHTLCGHILALIGLYDVVAVTGDKNNRTKELIQRGLLGLRALIEEFDAGYWTYYDLLHRRLAHRFYHSLHVLLLEVLAEYSDSEYYKELATRWKSYQNQPLNRLRYHIIRQMSASYDRVLQPLCCRILLPTSAQADSQPADLNQVCVPITAFPVAGGMRSVLACVAQVMQARWSMVYLTNYKGQNSGPLTIEVFGHKKATSPWLFPTVWLYCLAGGWKLCQLLRNNTSFNLLLPQDGVFSAVFAAVVGKLMGIRVVCMDHGNVTCFVNTAFRVEEAIKRKTYPFYWRVLAPLQSVCYWPSLRLFASIANALIDHFLVAGDEVEDVYRRKLGVRASQITRYAYMVDGDRFPPCSKDEKARMRARQGIAQDAIVITLINRLDIEKGLSFALEGIALAQAALPLDVRKRLKVLIAGEGPLHSQIETDIQSRRLQAICTLWGEAKPSDVVMLLGITDIFLYSGIRGTNYSMAVLEAMAAGCVVVASVCPQSNARLLAEGRGIAIKPANACEISNALVYLCNNLECGRLMGMKAREYVAAYHSAEALRRNLLRATFFVPHL